MTDAVIVSTARTGLAKSWRGAFNMTHGATMGGHAVAHAIARANLDLGGGRRRPDRAARCPKARRAGTSRARSRCAPVVRSRCRARRSIASARPACRRSRWRRNASWPAKPTSSSPAASSRSPACRTSSTSTCIARRGSPRTSPRSTGRCWRLPRPWRAATTSRASARTNTACKASSAPRPQRRPGGSRPRSCR